MRSVLEKWKSKFSNNLKYDPRKVECDIWKPVTNEQIKNFSKLENPILDEFEKCKNSIVYFIETYARNPQNGELIKLSEIQKRCLNNIEKCERISIYKSRQVGISFLMRVYALHTLIFKDNQNILYVCHNSGSRDTHKNLFKELYENLPGFLKIHKQSDNRFELGLKNSSKILFETPSIDATCSDSFNLVILEEFEHYKNLESFYMSIFPTVYFGKMILTNSLDWNREQNHKFIEKIYKELVLKDYISDKFKECSIFSF